MFRTKKDVDKHVQDIHSKIKQPAERNLKGYSIAKLYFGVSSTISVSYFVMIYHHSVGGGLRECQKVPGVLPSGEGLQLRGSQAQRSDLREAESTREGENIQ